VTCRGRSRRAWQADTDTRRQNEGMIRKEGC
jgi:hypothetical protein